MKIERTYEQLEILAKREGLHAVADLMAQYRSEFVKMAHPMLPPDRDNFAKSMALARMGWFAENRPSSTIGEFYGMHRLLPEGLDKLHFYCASVSTDTLIVGPFDPIDNAVGALRIEINSNAIQPNIDLAMEDVKALSDYLLQVLDLTLLMDSDP